MKKEELYQRLEIDKSGRLIKRIDRASMDLYRRMYGEPIATYADGSVLWNVHESPMICDLVDK